MLPLAQRQFGKRTISLRTSIQKSTSFSFAIVFVTVSVVTAARMTLRVSIDQSENALQNIADGFDKLADLLDELTACYAADGTRPETISCLDRAKKLARRGSALAEQQGWTA